MFIITLLQQQTWITLLQTVILLIALVADVIACDVA
jgi:hypothetical protein